MGQISRFDYSRPYFYMVTLRKVNTAPLLSRVIGNEARHYLEWTPLTAPLLRVIQQFHQTWRCIEPIKHFTIMPDHIHLLIKIRDVPDKVSLRVIVRQLLRALDHTAQEALTWKTGSSLESTPLTPYQVFEPEWHDWIVTRTEQLHTFVRYIHENPKRRWTRIANKDYFNRVAEVEFCNRTWYAYGNLALLERPVIEAFQCSRKWHEDSPEWKKALGYAARLGPGCAGISTFMSPCEKLCGNQIFKSGGGIILLCPEGFGDYWHPTRNKEKLCAEGRMLFLSLYPPATSKPDKATLYQRCHEMGDIVKTELSP